MSEISNDLVLRKMKEALVRLEEAMDQEADAAEHAQTLKTYCDLVIEAERYRSEPSRSQAPPVQNATVHDVEQASFQPSPSYSQQAYEQAITGKIPPSRQPGVSSGGTSRQGGKVGAPRKERPSIYDEGDEPESNSLLDF